MEEVWEDISLQPLNDHHSPATVISNINNNNNNNPTFSSITFQDFLATSPKNKEMPPITSSDRVSNAEEKNFFGSLVPTSSTTLLSMKSGSGLQSVQGNKQNPVASTATPCLGSSAVFPCFSKITSHENKENCEDRRHKRKMKNRESAARSRARKQAYTSELELEVAHLLEENAKLRKQQEKILAARNEVPKKNSLSRTLTAPF